jgi:hypothetical protein
MIDITRAIMSLTPNAQWAVRGDEVVWLDEEQDQPTEEEIVQKIAELEYTEEVEVYKKVRAKAYPVMSEQLDKIFHEGIDAWKAEIQAIKDAHPKAVIDNDTLTSRKSQALFDHQLKKYTKAIERLAQYIVADGREEVIESQATGEKILNEETGVVDDVMDDFVTALAIDPVEPTITRVVISDDLDADPTEETIENPLITQDNAERADAQEIVDATPQPVIDEYNS